MSVLHDIAMGKDESRESAKRLINGIGELLANDSDNLTVSAVLTEMTFMLCEISTHAGVPEDELMAIVQSGWEASNRGHSTDRASMN